MNFKLGRNPRSFNPRVPHYSALAAGRHLAAPPVQADYLSALPADLGVMLNDTLGDCTCAGVYHAIQVWTFATGAMETNPDANVLNIYEAFCDYNPKNPDSDQGGNEQTILSDWMKQGIPTIGPTGRNNLSAFIEVDVRNPTDIKRVIANCGVCYIGFNVPSNILPDTGEPPDVWTYDPSADQNIGGHAIILAGYTAETIKLVSWGKKYEMTWDFFQRYTEEAYALVNAKWANATGKTPLGMSLAYLETQMDAIRDA
jgi:hypothetical protein